MFKFRIREEKVNRPLQCFVFLLTKVDPVAHLVVGDNTSAVGSKKMAKFFRQDTAEVLFFVFNFRINPNYRGFSGITIKDGFDRRLKVPEF